MSILPLASRRRCHGMGGIGLEPGALHREVVESKLANTFIYP